MPAAKQGAVADTDETIVIEGATPRPRGSLDDLDSEGAEATDAERGLRDPAFVSVIRPGERAGETVDTAELLTESVGVFARSLGGLGSFSSISIRGAAAGQTNILVDGVPVSQVASTVTDLSSIDPRTVSRVEVYRGAAPLDFGGASIGGAVNFITTPGRSPDGRRFHLSVGGGSFGARDLSARVDDQVGRIGYRVQAAYRGATGDFSYFNDANTPQNSRDDSVVRRTNNDFDEASAVARAEGSLGDWTLTVGSRAFFKEQGLPGPGAAQSEIARLRTINGLVDAAASRSLPGPATGRVSLRAFGVAEDQWTREPALDAERGRSLDIRSLTLSAGVAGSAGISLGRHYLYAALDARGDRFASSDRVASLDVLGSRLAGGAAVSDEISFAGGRLVIAPGARLDWLRTNPDPDWEGIFADADMLVPRTDLFASPRVSARVQPFASLPGLVVKGSIGRYFRAPTVIEVFGTGGAIRGNPLLEAERGTTGDLGLVLAPDRSFGAVDRLYVETAGFASRQQDTIVFEPGFGPFSKAANIRDAWLYGFEARAELRLWRALKLSANYALVETRQISRQDSYDGQRLPQRPLHQVYARVDLARRVRGGRLFVPWTDMTVVSGAFLDKANRTPLAPRYLLGAGVKGEIQDGILLSVEVKNALDRRTEIVVQDPAPRPDLRQIDRAIADSLNYPLVGRAFYARLDVAF